MLLKMASSAVDSTLQTEADTNPNLASYTDGFWTGLHEKENEVDIWTYIDGDILEPLTDYRHWDVNEPNLQYPCVQIIGDTWSTSDCSNSKGYICDHLNCGFYMGGGCSKCLWRR
ncbi:uncharacterized protein LOC144344449 [Saccoglossus kowalevskii]